MATTPHHKYFKNFAEPEVTPALTLFEQTPCTNEWVVVIPAFAETPEFLQRLITTNWQRRVLAIVIINQPDTEEDPSSQQTLWRWITQHGVVKYNHNGMLLTDFQHSPVRILAIDRFSTGKRIPKKQGVGLARKIGADIAAALYFQGTVKSPWIFSTDADATLHCDYFSPAQHMHANTSAWVLPFAHQCNDSATGQATALYEQGLNYYVEALRWAGSPYAFHTIGSCLCVHADYYCQVRGFPKRAGGEDFYLLNKLNKTAPVRTFCSPQPLVSIQARLSQRVPFGTGPGVANIMHKLQMQQPYTYYAPEVFAELRQLLRQLNALTPTTKLEIFLDDCTPPIRAALLSLNIDELFNHLQKLGNEGKPASVLVKHAHDWFDAFKTLKLIHYLQTQHYPAQPLQQAVDSFSKLAINPVMETP